MDHDDLRAMVALTARLSSGEKTLGVLTPTEWDTVAKTIHGQGLLPRNLLDADPEALLATIAEAGKRLRVERLTDLLGRSEHVDRRLRDWDDNRIWLLARGNALYPSSFRQHLQATRPPLLWGCGNKGLLNTAGVAIVGSRDAEYASLRRSSDLGASVAAQGMVVISGGARGVDERAVEGALMAGGRAVIVLPDSLAVQAKKLQFRQFLANDSLALISPYSPDAGYQTGTAMGRNRLIYCLATAAIVVCSTRHAGGTFAGAEQALKSGWTQVWVERTDDPQSGNHILHERDGAQWLPEDDLAPVWSSIHSTATEATRMIRETPITWTPFE